MRPHIWERMLRFWEADRGFSIILALLVSIVFVLPSLRTPDSTEWLVKNLAFSALLIAGAFTVAESRWVRVGVAALAAAALLVRWVAVAVPSDGLVIGREASTLVMLLLFAMVVAARVYRSGPVTHHRIQGAVAVYLLLGLLWANAYELLYLARPAAFSGAVGNAPDSQTWIYYSFVTLTTMGYGEITPVHPIARSLAIAEAVTGQLYLAITLARLVSLYVGSRDKG
jgi:hypothetical protein